MLQNISSYIFVHTIPAAIAGVIDLLRTQGSFALSLRYALCLTLSNSKVEADPSVPYPIHTEYEEIAKVFETSLNDVLDVGTSSVGGEGNKSSSLEDISCDPRKRELLTSIIAERLRGQLDSLPGVKTTNILGDSTQRNKRGASSAMTSLAKFVS